MKNLSILILSLFLFSFTINEIQSDPKVIVCTGKYSKRYHDHICRGMKKCKGEIVKVKLSEAKKAGLSPCGYCWK